jgi:hypothetical protein
MLLHLQWLKGILINYLESLHNGVMGKTQLRNICIYPAAGPCPETPSPRSALERGIRGAEGGRTVS